MNIVTGSGRSGTSFVAATLQQFGADFIGDLKWDTDSRAGFEDKEINDINKLMFSINGLDKPNAVDWLTPKQKEKCVDIMRPMVEYIDKKFAGKWVKDPLFTKTLDVWIACGLNVENLVICTRNPWMAAASANKTSRGFSPVGPFSLDEIHREMLARTGKIQYLADSLELPAIKVRYEKMPQDIVALIQSVLPDVDIEKANKQIQTLWQPKV